MFFVFYALDKVVHSLVIAMLDDTSDRQVSIGSLSFFSLILSRRNHRASDSDFAIMRRAEGRARAEKKKSPRIRVKGSGERIEEEKK